MFDLNEKRWPDQFDGAQYDECRQQSVAAVIALEMGNLIAGKYEYKKLKLAKKKVETFYMEASYP